jgi:hypothetical protein
MLGGGKRAMNTLHAQRLAALREEIYRLDAEILERERESLDVLGTEEECEAALARVTDIRTQLDRALRSHFIEATFVLSAKRAAA